jgi:hypothetical protein
MYQSYPIIRANLSAELCPSASRFSEIEKRFLALSYQSNEVFNFDAADFLPRPLFDVGFPLKVSAFGFWVIKGANLDFTVGNFVGFLIGMSRPAV